MIKESDFDALKIILASPEEMKSWSHGEVLKPETINYRTQRPERDGLFCEKIFGPIKDYECACGKYKRKRYKGVVCDRCGVEVTSSSVRRERMGHIKLAAPVCHIWFVRGVPSRIGLLLEKKVQEIERVIYFMAYIITEVDEKKKKEIEKEIKSPEEQKELERIKEREILTEMEMRKFSLKYPCFKAETGAEAIKKLLSKIDLQKEKEKIENDLKKKKEERRAFLYARLKLIKSLLKSKVKPEWMCLEVLPVLPPDLRPMVQIDGGRYASSDLNDLYRRVINRNNRLKYLLEIGAPEVIVRNEKRMLQEAVDALIDNSMRRKPQMTQASGGGGRRQLKSLADMLRGKQGRFRQNLLGKRVDYSGRSVIVVGPELKLDEVGLPKKMALELFKPFVIHKLIQKEYAHNIKMANILIAEEREEVWEALEEVIKDKMVFLNRAPTLHRLSIQAFKVKLIEGLSIQIHPLVCPAFNADFDGDQMAVFIPLSERAQWEAKNIVASRHGILKPASGYPIALPRQDMILGIFYLTKVKPKEKRKVFSSIKEAKYAYEKGEIEIHEEIEIMNEEFFEKKGIKDKRVKTTLGRILFNEALPSDFPYQEKEINSKKISKLIEEIYEKYPQDTVIKVLDALKELGFEWATLSATTWGMDDLVEPKEKKSLLKEGEKKEKEIQTLFDQGFISEKEKREKIIENWQSIREKIAELVPKALPEFNSVKLIVEAGARGSWVQPIQMAGMKGLVINPAGEIIELCVKKSYKEGLTPLEYFISTHGARKGTVDTALRTAVSGYLTRRLVDVAHEVIVREKDCGDKQGIVISKKDAEEIGQEFLQKVLGRITLEDVKDKKGNVIVRKGEMITLEKAKLIEKEGPDEIRVRSPLSCKSLEGVCQKCYGMDLSSHKLVKLGEAVGVVAAQAIGEPGTQLTMRTFHVGGVAGVGDITTGLPRAEEIFEVRGVNPKKKAIICNVEGEVKKIERKKRNKEIWIKTSKEVKKYNVPLERKILVRKGEKVFPGMRLTDGEIDLKETFEISPKETLRYMLKEIQKVYSSQGVALHDKHIEVILKQTFSRVLITSSGDSLLAPGEIVPVSLYEEERERMKKEGKRPPIGKRVLKGISKVALSTASFLSAASFQETSRVLIQAALEGKVDRLRGLKENVIIGRLIPAGTGFR